MASSHVRVTRPTTRLASPVAHTPPRACGDSMMARAMTLQCCAGAGWRRRRWLQFLRAGQSGMALYGWCDIADESNSTHATKATLLTSIDMCHRSLSLSLSQYVPPALKGNNPITPEPWARDSEVYASGGGGSVSDAGPPKHVLLIDKEMRDFRCVWLPT